MRRMLWRLVGRRGFISYLLLLTALCSIAYGLSKSVLYLSFTIMSIVGILGLSFAWLCSDSHLKDWHVAILTSIMGITGSIYYFGRLSKTLIALLNAIRSAVSGVFTESFRSPQNFSPIYFAMQQMTLQLKTFFNSILLWGNHLFAGQVVHDELISSFLWSLAFWFAAVWAGWLIFRRHSAIISILPATALLAGSLNYVAANPIPLVPIIGTTLILKALTSYDQQELYWINHDIDYAEFIHYELSILVPALAVGFMLISLVAPSVSIQQIIRASQQVTQRYQPGMDSIAKSLGLVPHSLERNSFNSLRNPGLPHSHLLGSGPELSKDVVMLIQNGENPPTPSLATLPAEPPHYYWRSLTYDIYTGHGWETSSIKLTKYSYNHPSIEGFIPNNGSLRLVHQFVQFKQDMGGLIYSAGQLISVDKDYQVAWRITPPIVSSSRQNPIADEFGATFDTNSYEIDSYVNTVSLTRLHAASGDIPAWIKDRYLALPESLPTRVRQLALDLARDQFSEYDKAAKIETFLHTYPYTLDLPSPPPDRDVVDYFLFDLKRGYCDYFASAMVVMARVVGLPARLVTGYSSGFYDSENDYYIVTAANAHAWVEIYFSGIGWVEFEPTASFPTIQRLDDHASDSEIPTIRAIQPFTLLRWLDSIYQNWLTIFTATTGTLLLGIVLWVKGDQWRLRRLSPSMTIVQLYQRLYRLGKPMIEEHHIGDTPFEFAYRVIKQLKMTRSYVHLTNYFQHGTGETARLVKLYTQVVYSPHAIELGDQKTAIDDWVHLRMRLWIAVKLDNIKRFLSKKKLDH